MRWGRGLVVRLGVAVLGHYTKAVARRARSKRAAGCGVVVLEATAVAASCVASRRALLDGGMGLRFVRHTLANS